MPNSRYYNAQRERRHPISMPTLSALALCINHKALHKYPIPTPTSETAPQSYEKFGNATKSEVRQRVHVHLQRILAEHLPVFQGPQQRPDFPIQLAPLLTIQQAEYFDCEQLTGVLGVQRATNPEIRSDFARTHPRRACKASMWWEWIIGMSSNTS